MWEKLSIKISRLLSLICADCRWVDHSCRSQRVRFAWRFACPNECVRKSHDGHRATALAPTLWKIAIHSCRAQSLPSIKYRRQCASNLDVSRQRMCGHKWKRRLVLCQLWIKLEKCSVFRPIVMEKVCIRTLTWIAALNHEVANDTVENGIVVISTTNQFGEIAAGIRCVLPVQFDGNFAHSVRVKREKS